MNTLENEVIHS